MLYALLTICGLISLLSIMSRYFPLKLAASFFWLALLVFWLAEGGTYVTRGDPTDTILTVAFIFPPIIFMLWGLSSRVGKSEVEERYSSTGNLIDRIVRSTSSRKEPVNSSRESTLEYRERVRKAARGNRTRRRR